MGCAGFWDSFDQNMKAMGLDAPQNLFDSYDKAVTTLANIVAVAQLNPGASAMVALGSEGAAPAVIGLAAVGASYYAGAVAGSIMVASYDVTVCAMQSRVLTVGQIQAFLSKNHIYDSGLIASVITSNPRLARVS